MQYVKPSTFDRFRDFIRPGQYVHFGHHPKGANAITTIWIVSQIALWAIVLLETVLLLLLLRALGELKQNIESSKQPAGIGGLDIGTHAPLFSSVDQNNNIFRLEDTLGKRLILAFLLPGCPACVDTIGALHTLQQEDPHAVILVVGSADTKSNQKYAFEQELLFPILTPDESDLQKKYQVIAYPLVLVLDEQGIIRAKDVAVNYQRLKMLIDKETVSVLTPSSASVK